MKLPFRPSRKLLVEVFATANLGFLVLDVALAHSANAFRLWSEWIPVAGAAACALALAVGLVRAEQFDRGPGRWIGFGAGGAAVAIGIAGLMLHLDSQFFQTLTLGGLVYSAPFAAPLAFAGLGLLVVLNRMVPADTVEWGLWLGLLALGGFAGNFTLSLADHAQNGFFNPLEWLPVFVAALAVGFFVVALVAPHGRPLAVSLWLVLLLQAMTGVLGFLLHLRHLADPTLSSLRDRLLFGAPPFAPLLFTDLALLGGLAVWDLQAKGLFQAAPRLPAGPPEPTGP